MTKNCAHIHTHRVKGKKKKKLSNLDAGRAHVEPEPRLGPGIRAEQLSSRGKAAPAAGLKPGAGGIPGSHLT